MKRVILALSFILCPLLISCGGADYTINADANKNPSRDETSGEILYVVNTSTRSYHLPSCYILKNTKEENKSQTYDIDFLTERGYTPCKICLPT